MKKILLITIALILVGAGCSETVREKEIKTWIEEECGANLRSNKSYVVVFDELHNCKELVEINI